MANPALVGKYEKEAAKKGVLGVQSHKRMPYVIIDFGKFTFRQIDADTQIRSFDCCYADLDDFLFSADRQLLQVNCYWLSFATQ